MALGAVPARVLGMILGESFLIAAVGEVIGLGVALTASRFIGAVLFGLSPVDPWIYGSTAAIVLAVSLLASLLPALRASRVDPMTALRAE